MTSPEQSYVRGPVAPHTYGQPSFVSAYCTARNAVPLPRPSPPNIQAPDSPPGSPPPLRRLPISDAGMPDAKPLTPLKPPLPDIKPPSPDSGIPPIPAEPMPR